MSVEAAGAPTPDEIAALIGQCSAEELAGILASIEGEADASLPKYLGDADVPLPKDPVPPSEPLPAGGGARRPRGNTKPTAEASSVPMDQVKQMMQEHTAGILAEVQKALLGGGASGDGLDVSALTLLLSERDKEVQALEAKLSGLNAELGCKDQRMADLSGELDAAVREVRHRQLDLEFQQLKLEERVRSNAELEQSQRALAARVEEAGLQARHAALDAEMGSMGTPRSIRAQGSLPWMLRKSQVFSGSPGSITSPGSAGGGEAR